MVLKAHVATKVKVQKMMRDAKAIHRVYHDFERRFVRNFGFPQQWNVTVVRCDDGCHAGSMLVFVAHRAPRRYMGVTAVFIPQCTGESPIEFFLYPCHLLEVLRTVKKLYKEVPKVDTMNDYPPWTEIRHLQSEV